MSNKRQRKGQKGGKSRSEAKITAVRENGKFGGRPPKNPTKPNETKATETETETETETGTGTNIKPTPHAPHAREADAMHDTAVEMGKAKGACG